VTKRRNEWANLGMKTGKGRPHRGGSRKKPRPANELTESTCSVCGADVGAACTYTRFGDVVTMAGVHAARVGFTLASVPKGAELCE